MPLHLVRATEIKSGADQTAGALAAETAVRGHSCLIFCPSRKRTRTLAVQLARAFETTMPSPRREVASARDGLARALACAAEGTPDRDLVECCRRGVAYHHAHLSKREKDLVEDAFRRGTLHTLTCTTTLAAGVNLPARRVVILEGNYGNSASTYRQMAGRAGRAGQSDEGGVFRHPGRPGQRGGRKVARDAAAAAAFATVVSRLPRASKPAATARGWRRRGQRGDRGSRPPVHRGGNSSDWQRRVRPADEHVRVERTVASAETHRRAEGGARAPPRSRARGDPVGWGG